MSHKLQMAEWTTVKSGSSNWNPASDLLSVLCWLGKKKKKKSCQREQQTGKQMPPVGTKMETH